MVNITTLPLLPRFSGQISYDKEQADKSRMGSTIRGLVENALSDLIKQAEQDGLDYRISIGATGDGLLTANCVVGNKPPETIGQADARFRNLPVAFLFDLCAYVQKLARLTKEGQS